MNKLEKAARALENAVIALEELPLNLRMKTLTGIINNTENMRKEAIFLYNLSQATKPLVE